MNRFAGDDRPGREDRDDDFAEEAGGRFDEPDGNGASGRDASAEWNEWLKHFVLGLGILALGSAMAYFLIYSPWQTAERGGDVGKIQAKWIMFTPAVLVLGAMTCCGPRLTALHNKYPDAIIVGVFVVGVGSMLLYWVFVTRLKQLGYEIHF